MKVLVGQFRAFSDLFHNAGDIEALAIGIKERHGLVFPVFSFNIHRGHR